jgi:hypothetical protein
VEILNWRKWWKFLFLRKWFKISDLAEMVEIVEFGGNFGFGGNGGKFRIWRK